MIKKNKADKQYSVSFQTLKGAFSLLVFVGIWGFLFKTCTRGAAEIRALEGKTSLIRAVVIDKRNYYGNIPVSGQFSYSYRFSISGKTYEGNTRDPNLQVGDSLIIKYALGEPEYNKPLN